jgi:hypothetical protein
MIEDLKADSARWDSERRSQTSRNTSGVQYRNSETHNSRHQHGHTDPPYSDFSRDSGYSEGPRYPGSGAPGYTGAIGSYPPGQAQQQQQQQSYSSSGAPGYGAGYAQSPPPDPRYAQSQGNQMYHGTQDSPYIAAGANMPVGYAANDPYAASRTGSSAAAPQQPIYATTSPAQQHPGYPAPMHQAGYSSYGSQAPSSSSQAYAAVQPTDPFYGRASPAGQTPQAMQGYSGQGQQSQQSYGAAPHSRGSASASTPAPASSSTGSGARRNDREADRHHRNSRH